MHPGTRIRFKSPITTERSRKRGIARTFLIFQQCITCMPEYENKSLEELRFEDYVTKRKDGGATIRPILRQPVFGYHPAQSIGTSAAALGTTAAASGSTVKFKPRTAMEKPKDNGATSPIYTAYQCITCMEEYENKSLEELRLDDYSAMGMITATSQRNFAFCAPTTQHTLPSNVLTGAHGPTSVASGTSVRFKPRLGTETLRKNGARSFIYTVYRCITCMEEYENKSLEELRLEDYAAMGMVKATNQQNFFSAPTTQRTLPSGVLSGGDLYPDGSLRFGNNSRNTNLRNRSAWVAPAVSMATFGVSAVAGTPGTSTVRQPQHEPNAAFPFRPTIGAAATVAESAFRSQAETRASLLEAGGSTPSSDSSIPASGTQATTNLGGISTSSTASGGLLGAPNTTTAFGTGASTFGSTGLVATPISGTTGGTLGAPATRDFGTNTTAKPPGFRFGSTTSTTTLGGGSSTTSTRAIGSFGDARSRPVKGAAGTWGVLSTDISADAYFGFVAAATATPLEPRFGAPAANTSMFGTVKHQPAACAGIFGTPSASFGQPRPHFGSFASTTPARLFGQPQSTGLFGQPQSTGQFRQPQSTGLFGEPEQPQITGLFGEPEPQITGVFGQTPAANTSLVGTSGPSASSRPESPEQPSAADDICAICRDRCRDTAFVPGCFHAFCFACIVRWTRMKPKCPVCNQRFQTIIYGVRSIKDYEQRSVSKLWHPR